MIRSTLKRIAKKLLRRDGPAPSPSSAPQTPIAPSPPPPNETGTDQPWYLDGSETWGWENTNARDEESS